MGFSARAYNRVATIGLDAKNRAYNYIGFALLR